MVKTFVARVGRILLSAAFLSAPHAAAAQVVGGAAPNSAPNPNVAPTQAGTSAVSGVAIDGSTNQPLAGVVVYLGPPQHGPPGVPVRQTTDARGRFVFTHLPAFDGYFINASKPGYIEGHYGRASSGQLGARISVLEGQWVQNIRVVMNRPASIAGTVLDDRGEPIVGAIVRVLRHIPIAGQVQLAAGHFATTDDRGAYRIANLLPANYYVQMPSVQNAFPSSTPATVLAGAGQQMIANAQTQGRAITFTEPMIDVDAANQLLTGRYPVPPRSADGRMRAYPVTFHPAASGIDGATTISLAAGDQRTGVDLRVTPVVGHRVTGKFDGPPEAFAGMTVRLLLRGAEDLGEGGEAATALVDQNGQFTFINVPGGSYVVDARDSVGEYQFSGVTGAPRSAPTMLTPGVPSSNRGAYGVFTTTEGVMFSYRNRAPMGGQWARDNVTVDSRDVTNVVLTPKRTSSISGRYVYEGARSSLSGISGLLSALPARGGAGLGVPRSRENPAGPDTFIIEGLMPGEYVIDVLSMPLKSITCDGRDYTDRPIDMRSGQDITDCVVTFTNKTIQLTGTARDERGQGQPETGIIIFPAERELWEAFGFSPNRIKSVQATNTGFFRFQSLPAGDYLAIAVPVEHVNAWREPGFLQTIAPQATRVHLNWGDTVTQDLKPQAIKWPR